MPNYRRPRAPGATVFFTVCLADRSWTLLTDEIAILREAVRYTRARRPFGIDAWVVLPNHMHAIWTLPADDGNYSERWGAIKARFSKHFRLAGRAPEVPAFGAGGGVNPALRKGQSGIWQPRFWEHHIRDRQDLEWHLAACHEDPVKHGLAGSATDWAYSSVHRDLRNRHAA
ncbi:REP-associated tyrosine transposase [Seohaeicola zhoushanensis]|uniref:Transposase n=1 Tax=Seohaeicola zhoushanensis TaxID=1569283 RepID=A0A8J3MCB3_9RHOB|nr:transposase [Seohaeicola zhoushanensis]GHF72857.1 transposase [Seohaeicola zhoushanensis]